MSAAFDHLRAAVETVITTPDMPSAERYDVLLRALETAEDMRTPPEQERARLHYDLYRGGDLIAAFLVRTDAQWAARRLAVQPGIGDVRVVDGATGSEVAW